MHALDVDAYFERIGHRGKVDASLDTLNAIHRLHPAAIAFENLNPWLGLPVTLDTGTLARKLIYGRRGGYCFEHNLLLAEVLRHLGFAVTPLAARVMWNAPEGSVRPRSHMLLRIELDGESWVADVGFGGQTLTAPLRLHEDAPQTTPHERFRLRPEGEFHVLEIELGSDWKPLYRFDQQPQEVIDYEVTSWYLCHHPQSMFRQVLVAARAAPDARYALLNNQFTRHGRDGRSETRHLGAGAEVRRTLEQVFGLELPRGAQVDERLQAMVERWNEETGR
jgi:N-hydroxyarylamine O-acetyltransferase